jgi:general secretion pathway protein G
VRQRGFTLVELMLVMLIVALLASLVAPVVTGGITRAKESTLQEDLHAMRKAIDAHYADTGAYPGELDQLVQRRYLRRVPVDPFTERYDTWVTVRDDGASRDKASGIIDIRSGSEEKSSDGTFYRDW